MLDKKELTEEELEKATGGNQCGDQDITDCIGICENICKNCKYLDGEYDDATYGLFDYVCTRGKGSFYSNNKYFTGGIEKTARKTESEVVQNPR